MCWVATSWVATSWQYYPNKVPGKYEPVRIDKVGSRYAVRQEGCCMDANGVWDQEPMPSSRTNEWLAQFRFATATQARRAVERYCTPLGRFLRTDKE